MILLAIIITLAGASFTTAEESNEIVAIPRKWNSLRVTLSADPAWAFQGIPLDFWEADRKGWRATSQNCTNGGKFNGYRFIPKEDDSIAALYDINGNIAGLQMLPKRNKIMTQYNAYQFDNQPMFQNDSVLGVNVTVLTAYFIDPSTICTTGRTDEDLKANGTGTGLWFQSGLSPDNLTVIAETKKEALEEGWRDNQCLPMMGFFSFYQSETWDETSCADFVPAWVFYDLQEKISGFGFFVTGYDDSPRYQHPQGVLVQHFFGASPNDCAGILADSIGVTVMNVYFDDVPELIACEIKYPDEHVSEDEQNDYE